MSQQINLYQPIFRQPKRVFSALALLQVVVLIAIGCGGVYAYSAWQLRGLAVRVTELERARDAAVLRLDELRRQFPARVVSPLLQAELARLDLELKRNEALAGALTSGKLGNTSGLSEFLLGLARQHIGGTWLTRIEIAGGGSVIGVRGNALAPELIPVYLRRLADEPAFAGKSFSNIELKQVSPTAAAPANTIEFSIHTEGLVAKEDERG